MKKMNKAWILAVSLLLLAPTSLLAQDAASKDFPNDKDANTNNVALAASGTMRFRLQLNGPMPDVDTGTIPFALGGHTGAAVAAAGVNALCLAAVNANYLCHGVLSVTLPAGCNGGLTGAGGVLKPALGFDACCAAVAGDTVAIYCDSGALFGPRFKIDRTSGVIPENFMIAAAAADLKSAKALHHTTNAGNTVASDILPQYCVRVDRGSPAVDGNINFSVVGGPSAGSFGVNSTGLSDEALHNAIAAGFKALPSGGLTAVLLPNAAGKCRSASNFQGPTVFLPNVQAKNVTRIAAGGVPDQIVSAETSVPGGNIPTLSEWGLIFLAAILSISALWMLRRRRQIGTAA